ncbi:hypothetical protein ISS96_02975 [Candidatus Bathyarchaeota archaeon]|nr:hypothetical protein [Candidatus Bathyarchaeota archaeon]
MISYDQKKGRTTESWRLVDLGIAEPLIAQTFYEAVAKAVDEGESPNTIVLVQPSSPYVCIGYHQEIEREVDIEYCRSRNLPIIRRSQGGGAVYLDSNQIFYQIVARDDSKTIPLRVDKLFEKLLGVTVQVYNKLGLPAEFKPLNDVIVDGKKISGNGAGKFGDKTMILVGNIILDLNYESMANVLKVPSEKFKDKISKSMRQWVTSLKRELEFVPPIEEIKGLLAESYEQVLGIELVRSKITETEEKIWEEKVRPKHLSKDWLYPKELGHKEFAEERTVKIAGAVRIVEVDHKARKLIRVRAELAETQILDIVISGDFFMIPENAIRDLELGLRGTILERDELLGRIQRFYEKSGVQTPGLTREDFAEALMKLRNLSET